MKALFYFSILVSVALPAFASSAAVADKRSRPVGESPQNGIASWYGAGFVGSKTANGETYRSTDRTAAHKTLPFGTWVKVTERRAGRSTVVRINNRGPYVRGRVIDLSRAAASEIGLTKRGIAPVTIEVLPSRANTVSLDRGSFWDNPLFR